MYRYYYSKNIKRKILYNYSIHKVIFKSKGQYLNTDFMKGVIMEKFKLEILFNNYLVFSRECEGFQNGLEFYVNVEEGFTFTDIPQDTLVKVNLITPEYKIPLTQEFFYGGGEMAFKPQVITVKAE